MISIPFDLELAKKITNGEAEGRVVRNFDNANVRIVCFDQKCDGDYLLGCLVLKGNREGYFMYNQNGKHHGVNNSDYDLMLEVPEYMTFKDGDIIKLSNDNCTWLAIIKDIAFDTDSNDYVTHDYVSVLINDGESELDFNSYSDAAEKVEKATEEEAQELIDLLKVSKACEAKECLKKLGIEEKPEYEFTPFEKVLVKNFEGGTWTADIFSYNDTDGSYVCVGGLRSYCIPYNNETAHLLGTTENYE